MLKFTPYHIYIRAKFPFEIVVDLNPRRRRKLRMDREDSTRSFLLPATRAYDVHSHPPRAKNIIRRRGGNS